MTISHNPQTIDHNQVVADNLRAELARERWSGRQAAAALGLDPLYVTRRTSGKVVLSPADIVMFAEFLKVPVARFFVNEKDAPESAGGRAGASGISGIVLMDSVRKVGPAGIEPTTSTV